MFCTDDLSPCLPFWPVTGRRITFGIVHIAVNETCKTPGQFLWNAILLYRHPLPRPQEIDGGRSIADSEGCNMYRCPVGCKDYGIEPH